MPNINDHEYSIFSQNGEDGIIDFLTSGLKDNRRRFIEIGTSDGGENNSMYLLRRGWTGLGIDVDPDNIKRYLARVGHKPFAQRLTLALMKVGWDNCQWIIDGYGDTEPDFFSLDIDSVDYYVAYRMLQRGFRPSVFTVHGDAGRVDNVSVYASRLQPPGQPETVSPSLEGQCDPVYWHAHSLCLRSPTRDQTEQCIRIWIEFLEGLSLNAGEHSGHQPAILTHFYNDEHSASLIQYSD